MIKGQIYQYLIGGGRYVGCVLENLLFDERGQKFGFEKTIYNTENRSSTII